MYRSAKEQPEIQLHALLQSNLTGGAGFFVLLWLLSLHPSNQVDSIPLPRTANTRTHFEALGDKSMCPHLYLNPYLVKNECIIDSTSSHLK